ncbi:GNAT family N-acetyltransferase [Microvirga lotononidis]|uniref:Acetyltransferase n=1 Tax=Microvirga lotononidis TaxID=864069 RepID=I4Z227_9HYPH|nr:GNAT family N-acetyltransferase [Microvirga lotononidis]EIM30269.1 acetyltransferase [Microvirga lotononidis]WQO31130.1 GNAT family N-acetyltransferase [Microvirga lotononidis]
MSDVEELTSLTIRPLAEGDSIEALTALLHRAYAGLAALGFNYTAVDQTAEVTRSRIRDGQCFVADLDGTIVGAIMFYPPGKGGGCPWYDNPEVAKIGQFGVEPHLQGRGVGARLLDHVEAEAIRAGIRELALDTAEGATHLVAWYERCGYRFIEHAQWRGKVYRSVILSKSLA